eukprot:TRINITY_DN15044_c0_g2_i1.p1 TRINITY_DN15044_c0_g2~~TRINITY_DN15044_c0_g2_i1.p1  ORF type:complete len:383 (+),score=83.48 TRINITY_DN15044_c0_g2_i1:179-1327(+)
MGQSFGGGGPITDKDSGDDWSQELGLAWGFSGMQGWRDGMEDAHLAVPSMGAWSPHASSGSSSVWDNTATFGVFDGHGGESVALFCQRHMPAEIAAGPCNDLPASLVDAFHHMDEMLRDPANLNELRSLVHGVSPQAAMRAWTMHPNYTGCTAIVCCVRHDSITCANAGDSRAVLCRAGRAVDLSEDHKPNLPRERARIAKAGGFVEEQRIGPWTQYRVNGNLNLSRSIGDLSYKRNRDLAAEEQMICATPDVRTFVRGEYDEFLILACDGVWDVLSSQEVVDHVRSCLGDMNSLEERLRLGELRLSSVLASLLDLCLSPDLHQTMGLGGDNMTAVLVVFLPSQRGLRDASIESVDQWRSGGNGWLRQGGVAHGPKWWCPHC